MTPAPDLTRNESLVFGALSKAQMPLSAYRLLDQLRVSGLRAPVQVYRALEKLVEYGVVHRLESVNAFVACAHPRDHGHGLTSFAICNQCGKVEEFSDVVVDKRLQAWASDHAFRVAKTAIELRGVCSACAAA